MKYRLLFVFLLVLQMLFSAEAIAQSVCSADLSFSDTAIVRTFGENRALTYTGGNFVLCEGTNNTARAFAVPFNVKDVEVWEDSVAYFCGEYGGRGVMGRFNILDAFAGVAPINYASTTVSATNSAYINCTTDVLDITRLALFKDVLRNTVVLAMVCREDLLGTGWIRTSVMGAYFNPMVGWNTCVYYNKDGDWVYHDIETLDNMVVATMTDTNIEGCYVQTFENNYFNFPFYTFPGATADRISLNNPVGPPQITRMRDNSNTAIIVQCDEKPGVTMHFLEFDVATGHPSNICPSAITPKSDPPFQYNSGQWWSNGVRYLEDTLYVLGNMNFPGSQGFDKWLLEVPNICSSRNGFMHKFTVSEPYSLDGDRTVWRPVTAGQYYLMLDWDVYIPQGGTDCKEAFEIDIKREWPVITGDEAYGADLYSNQTNQQLIPIIYELTVRKDCDYETKQE